jgi:hypothetical protein
MGLEEELGAEGTRLRRTLTLVTGRTSLSIVHGVPLHNVVEEGEEY